MASTTTGTGASTSTTPSARAIRTAPWNDRSRRGLLSSNLMAQFPPRRRSPGSDWFRRVNDYLTPTVKALVIADAAVYLFFVLVPPSRAFIEAHLTLTPGFFAGELWQPITALFVHLDFLNFLFNLIGLWSVGSTIDRARGTRRFLTLFFVTGVLANLAIAAFYRHYPAAPVSLHDGAMFSVVALFVANARI